MDDYISRAAAIKALEKLNPSELTLEIFRAIEDVPAADVEPVRHGVWENTSKMYGVYSGRCSVCKLGSGMWHINQPYRFCPFCGTRLKLEDKKK